VNGRRVLLVLQKEGREALRDRRTLFVTLVLPMLLYPALMIGLGTAAVRQQGKLQEATQKVAFAGPVPSELREALAATKGLVVAEPADPQAALRAGEVHLVVRAAPDFAEALDEGRTARLELLHDSASEPSAESRRKAVDAVVKYREKILSARLADRGIDRAWINPIEVPPPSATDVASAGKRGAHVFGRILSMMLVIMVVTGAFTPAVDSVAGEKERGTMETLLVCPATRLEVVLGKFLAVLAVSVATALGNLLSMGLTFGQFASSLGVKGQVDFHIGIGTAATIFAILLPMAALFAAMALALSTLARSTKEAQTYLTPLMLVSLPLAMVSVVPNIELTFGLASVPVSGAVLLFRDLLLAQGEPALLGRVAPMVPVVLGTTALAAGLAIRWAVWMFEREEVLFRDPGEAFSWKDLRPVRRAGSVPGPGAAFFLPAAALAATYFLAQSVLAPETLGSPLGVSLQQGVMLAAVAAAIALARLDPRATLGLRLPGALPAAGALLLGCGSAAATPWLTHVLGAEPRPDGKTAAILEKLVRENSGLVLVLLLGVLPALAEEALFRGWSFRGLRSQMSGLAAVVLSSVLFGAFHLEPERIAFTTALGLALGFMALRTGSLCPGILAHALHNGITVGLAKSSLDAAPGSFPARFLGGGDAALGAAGLAAAAAGLALVWFATRAPARDSLPPAPAAR
jgi:sodium transport system permease protein